MINLCTSPLKTARSRSSLRNFLSGVQRVFKWTGEFSLSRSTNTRDLRTSTMWELIEMIPSDRVLEVSLKQ